MNISYNKKIIDLSKTQVMGILNITPDSFTDGGRYNSLSKAIQHTSEMINNGATIIDVGGESSRPGAGIVSTEEELHRVIPIVEALSQRFDICISVDTSKPEVILESATAGAHLINDIRSLSLPGALEAAVSTGLPVCLMHMRGQPVNMQDTPLYADVVAEVSLFFSQQIQRCTDAGIKREHLILDPGFGFCKTLEHNYQLLSFLRYFKRYGLPVLVGMSRKSMLGDVIGNVRPEDRLNLTVASSVIAALQGAHIIRVHDVRETYEALQVVDTMLNVTANNIYY